MIDNARAARDVVARALAARLVPTLDDRPFVPTAAQLVWVDGGDLTSTQDRGTVGRIVAGRHAALFADHVIGDITADGAPGAYIRILGCARQAFLQSVSLATPPDLDTLRWENEGGARGQRVAVC